MSYLITAAADVMRIKEQEYGVGEEIKFAAFDSCIGVVAKIKNEDKVVGIHLVRIAKDDTDFDVSAAGAVMEVLRSVDFDPNVEPVLIGQLSEWEADQHSKAGYAALLTELKSVKPYQWRNGTYGAEFEEGKIVPTY